MRAIEMMAMKWPCGRASALSCLKHDLSKFHHAHAAVKFNLRLKRLHGKEVLQNHRHDDYEASDCSDSEGLTHL